MDQERYKRQLIFKPWGEAGQQKLHNASVFIAGAGGLGSPVALYLAAAGVGNIHICDSDAVELSNLNRQILHDEKSISTLKVDSAKHRLTGLNSTISITTSKNLIDEQSVSELVGNAQIIVDCLDNFETRYLLNRQAVQQEIPLVHAGIMGMSGQLTFLHPPKTPCLYCLFPDMEHQGTIPVVGAAVGVLGALEAVETLKYLIGSGEPLEGCLLIYDGLSASFEKIEVYKNPACPVCSISQSHP